MPIRLDTLRAEHIELLNAVMFKCETTYGITGLLIESPIQLTRYQTDDFFKVHVDAGRGVNTSRRVSVSIQLSEADAYVGGDLVLMHQAEEIGRAHV